MADQTSRTQGLINPVAERQVRGLVLEVIAETHIYGVRNRASERHAQKFCIEFLWPGDGEGRKQAGVMRVACVHARSHGST